MVGSERQDMKSENRLDRLVTNAQWLCISNTADLSVPEVPAKTGLRTYILRDCPHIRRVTELHTVEVGAACSRGGERNDS